MSKSGARRLGADEVRYRCDLSGMDIRSSADVSPSPTTVGQPEALEALKLGITMRRPGYNIFVVGETGTGRFAATRLMIEKAAIECPLTVGYSYVHNFDDPDRPRLVTLPMGLGRKFRNMLDRLRTELTDEIPNVLAGEPLTRIRDQLVDEYQTRSQSLFRDFEERVEREGFQVVQSTDPGGNVQVTDIFVVVGEETVPVDQLRPVPEDDPELAAQRRHLLERHAELKEELRGLMAQHRRLRTEYQERLQEHQKDYVRAALAPLFDEVKARFAEHDPHVAEFLDRALDEILEHLHLFMDAGQEAGPEQARAREHTDGLLGLLRSNLINEPLDENGPRYCPVLEENFPTARNLFGTIETGGEPSATTFMDIKGGTLLEANGGFLILSARDVMAEPRVYDTLKRTLRRGELEITPQGEGAGAQLGLKPEPIPIDVKVILVGESAVYEALYQSDPDFRKIFKIKAEFDNSMRLTDETLRSFLSVLRAIQDRDDLPDFDRGALETLVEEAVRMSGQRRRLTTGFSDLADVMREAAHLARENDHPVVLREDTERAIRGRHLRHNLPERRLHDYVAEGKLLLEVEGERVGQINGLAYYDVDNAAFGMTARITATTAIGREGVVNIEREADLSGNIHDKGVLILSGFLAQTFAQDKPLCLQANLAFEQSYVMIDGDSAALAELLALLSSLSGHPLRQDLAVTGSLNQSGRVQPVGGVTQKVEGFYHACKLKGLTGSQGVVIPTSNIDDLQLSTELTDLIAARRFHLFAVDDFRQALELLTGRPPQQTLEAVDTRLRRYSEIIRRQSTTPPSD